MIIPRQTQLTKDADAKAAESSYADAINLYEAALDGSPSSAEVHYKLALIYDDKMNDPLNALHHFKRFLALEPSGKRAQEVKGFMKRDELTLLTNLTGDSMVPRSELVRLTNENLSLRRQIGEHPGMAVLNDYALGYQTETGEIAWRADDPDDGARAVGHQVVLQRSLFDRPAPARGGHPVE